ncbi:hypothetical protein I7I53_05313 [Histoplasma capsulatum var. duboisii H88]|uniref:Uncharacterized protein n=2 Tax=Ajellomyces capsulatus TaxID=5037 RepID=A0A8H8D5P5_AJECA|nr:hypothetical protein I7I52_00563 [Histoplasma capsulatum]QSS56947.1 hypothetical protein I7I53_05313 [Histoplasma capsulatum var. duboisii H88]QSS71790.1 hypothetical protein I7I50_02771 [Histoplasma capsulatum G186AR]
MFFSASQLTEVNEASMFVNYVGRYYLHSSLYMVIIATNIHPLTTADILVFLARGRCDILYSEFGF